jgi:hypothetical protein
MNKLWCFLGVHELQVIEQGPYEFTSPDRTLTGKYYIFQCDCCGKIKYKKVY